MVVKITPVTECPSCHADLTPDPDSEATVNYEYCPECQRSLKTPVSQIFRSPDYLWYQRARKQQEIDNRIDKFLEQKAKPSDAELNSLEETKNATEVDFIKWVRECTREDKLAALYDALVIVENLVFTDMSPKDIQFIVEVCKKISKISTAVDEYFRAGGSRYDRTIRSVRPYPGSDTGNYATATARRDSP